MAQRNYSSTAAPTTITSSIVAGDTVVPVSSVAGYPLPPFTAAIDRGQPNEECILVTAAPTGVSWTIQRGYDSTTPSAHASGARFEHAVAAIDYREANQHVNAAAGVHGLTGNVVGDSDTQTLTNKTLAAPVLGVPVITDFGSASHDHNSLAKGGPTYPRLIVFNRRITDLLGQSAAAIILSSDVFPYDNTHRYDVRANSFMSIGTAGSTVQLNLLVATAVAGAAAPTIATTSTVVDFDRGTPGGSSPAQSERLPVERLIEAGEFSSGQMVLGLSGQIASGTGTWAAFGRTGYQIFIKVWDLGVPS